MLGGKGVKNNEVCLKFNNFQFPAHPPEYQLFLFLGSILLMFLLLLIMTVCVTLVMKDTSQEKMGKTLYFGDKHTTFVLLSWKCCVFVPT